MHGYESSIGGPLQGIQIFLERTNADGRTFVVGS